MPLRIPRSTLRAAPLVLAGVGLAWTIRSDDAQTIASYVDPASGERAEVSLGAYKQHLWRRIGRGEVESFVAFRVLESEARRLGLAVDGDLDAAVEAEWRSFVDARFHGAAEAARAELEQRGVTEQDFRAHTEERLRTERLEDAIILATREVGEADVRARFERDFGVGGVRVEVRHVYLARARIEQELLRAGRRPEDLVGGAVEAEIDRRLAALADELAGGTDFAAIAARASHDLATQHTGGRMRGYNYDRFGPELAAAIRQSPEGEVRRALTPTGGHLFVVDTRTRTRFEDVEAEIAAALASEEPAPHERAALRRRLLTAADLRRE